MWHRRASLALLLLLLALTSTASAQALQSPRLPDALAPWADWVLDRETRHRCAWVHGTRTCVWPGRLTLDAGERQGSLALDVEVEVESEVPLPGSPEHWPRDIRANGAPARVVGSGDEPRIRLPAGRHRVTARFDWARRPESLRVPPLLALIDLLVDGKPAPRPRRDPDGTLWLQSARADTNTEQRVELEVIRVINDGVPVELETRLRLYVSGDPRELDLGRSLPDGFVPTRIRSDLPVRVAPDGGLLVQLRPGTWNVTLNARSLRAVDAILAIDRPEPWPADETWAFQADTLTRSVRLEGLPGVDPERASLPDDLRAFPSFLAREGETLRLVELRRGETETRPDMVTLSRNLWLDPDGSRFTVVDELHASIARSGRIDALEPATVGRIDQAGSGKVVTKSPEGRGGIELRDQHNPLRAVLTYPGDLDDIPATGWNRDVTSLHAALHLPPGWQLLHASGVDSAHGSWFTRWSLLDVFFLLVLTVATFRLWGPAAAALVFLPLGLGWHEPANPAAWLLAFLALAAIERFARGRRGHRIFLVATLFLFLGTAIVSVRFVARQLQVGIFPQLDETGSRGAHKSWEQTLAFDAASAPVAPGSPPMEGFDQQEWEEAPHQEAKTAPSRALVQKIGVTSRGESGYQRGALADALEGKPGKKTRRAEQIDPADVVQTGPGIPTWSWRQHSLSWDGPVSQTQSFRLWLLSPAATLALSLFRGLGVLLLLLFLGRALRGAFPSGSPTAGATTHSDNDPTSRSPAASLAIALVSTIALLVVAPAPASAEGTPNPDLLRELRERLVRAPDCGQQCAVATDLALDASPGVLRITATVHADTLTGWRLPGPGHAWSPDLVAVDGAPTFALVRQPDGFFVLRLPPGIHTVTLQGAARDNTTLQFPEPPRVLRVEANGWIVDGWRPDAPPPGSIQLTRMREGSDDDARLGDGDPGELIPPWIELTRELDIGVPWLVHNRVRRVGGSSEAAVLLRVPMLPGETLSAADLRSEGTDVLVALDRNETEREWDSRLAETPTLRLQAPENRPWYERWSLACSPVWSCEHTGLAPIVHLDNGRTEPFWKPWPGETVDLAFRRPVAVDGATATIGSVDLRIEAGSRIRQSTLQLVWRTSQGGQYGVRLPPGSAVSALRINDVDAPSRLVDDRVTFSLRPGEQRVHIEWREERPMGVVDTLPAIDPGLPAANVSIVLQPASSRWLLWAGGPPWGPVVTLWQYLAALLVFAAILARVAPTPLGFASWALLLLGMSQIELVGPILVSIWLIGLGLLDRLRFRLPALRALAMLAVVGATFLALGMLVWAVVAGLQLHPPDMGVRGDGSWDGNLRWFVPRTEGALPTPWTVTLPLWTWNGLMLLWALWLAQSLIRWLRWGWGRMTGMQHATPPVPPPPSAPPPSTWAHEATTPDGTATTAATQPTDPPAQPSGNGSPTAAHPTDPPEQAAGEPDGATTPGATPQEPSRREET